MGTCLNVEVFRNRVVVGKFVVDTTFQDFFVIFVHSCPRWLQFGHNLHSIYKFLAHRPSIRKHA
jgi:hypothetical protein